MARRKTGSLRMPGTASLPRSAIIGSTQKRPVRDTERVVRHFSAETGFHTFQTGHTWGSIPIMAQNPLRIILPSVWIGLSALSLITFCIPGALPQARMDRAFGPPVWFKSSILIFKYSRKRQRREPYQPGATPQVQPQAQNEQGLKARSIAPNV